MKDNKLQFLNAEETDLPKMAKIEEEFFDGYERAFNLEFLEKWYNHNKDMFFVVKDSEGNIPAFVVLVPVDEVLYDELLTGAKSDLYDFDQEHVFTTMESKYYYIADICISKNAKYYMKTAGKLMVGAASVIYTYADFVTTSPITKEGLQMCKHLGFKEVAKQEFNGEIYSIYELKIQHKSQVDEIPKSFQKVFIQKRQGDK